jgi:hypothetical protein
MTPASPCRAAIIGHGGIVSVPIFMARYVLPQITYNAANAATRSSLGGGGITRSAGIC